MQIDAIYTSCTVLQCKHWNGGVAELTVAWQGPSALPGQFAMLRGDWGDAPLLPRAISFFDCTADTAVFLFRVIGEGTHRLAKVHVGERIAITGPLGNAFPVIEGVWLVAGGIGLPPLAFYQQRYGGRLFWGVSTRAMANHWIQDDWDLASEDGTVGFHGTVVQRVEQNFSILMPKAVLACGPYPMLTALWETCRRYDVPLYVSLEGKMACGVGICCGCAHKATAGGYVHVCEHGPIFDAGEVFG